MRQGVVRLRVVNGPEQGSRSLGSYAAETSRLAPPVRAGTGSPPLPKVIAVDVTLRRATSEPRNEFKDGDAEGAGEFERSDLVFALCTEQDRLAADLRILDGGYV